MVEPCCSMEIRAATTKITAVFSWDSQATITPVQPTSSVKEVERMPEVPTLKEAARPIRQADRNTVRSTMAFTFMPA